MNLVIEALNDAYVSAGIPTFPPNKDWSVGAVYVSVTQFSEEKAHYLDIRYVWDSLQRTTNYGPLP